MSELSIEPPPAYSAIGRKSGKKKFNNIKELKNTNINGTWTLRSKKHWIQKNPSNNGFIRLYTPNGEKSTVIAVTINQTTEDICNKIDISSIYVQIGNLHIRKLLPDSRPLWMQNDILMTLGHKSIEEVLSLGDSNYLRYIITFFIDCPIFNIEDNLFSSILLSTCMVKKNGLLQKWMKKKCILFNGTIRLINFIENKETGLSPDDEILLLSKLDLEIIDCSRGKCMKLSEKNGNYILVSFDDPDHLPEWSVKASQCQMVPNCDLSDKFLVYLPEYLFASGKNRNIVNINLRRNSLITRSNDGGKNMMIGYVDDLVRFTSLRCLNLSSNCLHSFPMPLCQITSLVELDLSGNQINIIPSGIRHLRNLKSINLSNNWLKMLPKNFNEFFELTHLDLSFNRFTSIPEPLNYMEHLESWLLTGNEISNINVTKPLSITTLQLRLNNLTQPIILNSLAFQKLTKLDLRHGGFVRELDLSNVTQLQILYCSNLGLKVLSINGSNIRQIYASNNHLDEIIIMPVPFKLIAFDISYNCMDRLPDWIPELNCLISINASYNRIFTLPYRLFMNMPSLRFVDLRNNELTKLPELVENCCIETLNLSNNKLQCLSKNLLKSAHRLTHLNISNNKLTSLPNANNFTDLNRMQVLKMSRNQLSESCIPVIMSLKKLRHLDISYNNFYFFNDSTLLQLQYLEEINISCNNLSSMGEEFSKLQNLQILRVHTNKLKSIPSFNQSKNLKILDLSNNRLSTIVPEMFITKNLKFLDLTCNVNEKNKINKISVKSLKKRVDVKRNIEIEDIGRKGFFKNLQYGFSESNGDRKKMSIHQIRPKEFDNIYFGMVDGGGNNEIALKIKKLIEEYLEDQTIVTGDVIRKCLLNSHEMLGKDGNRLGGSALILSIIGEEIFIGNTGSIKAIIVKENGYVKELTNENSPVKGDEYDRIRSANAIITDDNCINGIFPVGKAIGYSYQFPAILPMPDIENIKVTPNVDHIIISNRECWKYLNDEDIKFCLKLSSNCYQIAKMLQDIIQSNDYTGNISILVIKITNKQMHFSNEDLSDITKTESSKNLDNSTEENALRKIEERLEKISQAISKIETDVVSSSHSSLRLRDVKRKKIKRPIISSSASAEDIPENSLISQRLHRDTSVPAIKNSSINDKALLYYAEDGMAIYTRDFCSDLV
uniref:PPM-type phosphatase domain-containing protein n=1 Tax=Strongyloides papillosus TaxID=174720 RepID=A0A0N5BG01_STREA